MEIFIVLIVQILYRMYYAQSLYKACLYEEAMKVSCQIDNPQYAGKVNCILLRDVDIHVVQ